MGNHSISVSTYASVSMESEIVRVVSLSKTEISEITRIKFDLRGPYTLSSWSMTDSGRGPNLRTNMFATNVELKYKPLGEGGCISTRGKAPPGWLSGERVGLMTWWLRVRSLVKANFLSGVFSPLTSAEACEKSGRWFWKEKLC